MRNKNRKKIHSEIKMKEMDTQLSQILKQQKRKFSLKINEKIHFINAG